MIFKQFVLFFAAIFLSNMIFCQKEFVKDLPVTQHPRLLLLKNEESQIKKVIAANAQFKKVDLLIRDEALKMISLAPLERKQIGRRLLAVSREAIRRIMFLAYSYRMTNDKRLAAAAEKEMLAVSNFENWNPAHFLDVAEMTTAVAIGYDWLYDVLPSSSKEIIKNAIIVKGLNPSFDEKYNWFLKANHNWNQVCNGGMTFGALAVFESEPELAKKVINRAIESIHLPMDTYAPDGAYPEGYGYWGYGTSYNVLFINALEKIYKTDFGLSAKKGFLSTADYLLNMLGTGGSPFNYSDNGIGAALNTSMFWFASKTKKAALLRNEIDFIKIAEAKNIISDRFLPTLLIWGKDVNISATTVPKNNFWRGEGLSPVALMRTSWTDKNAIYVGLKAGSPGVNHAHMDVGSFVMDADGIRWAMDFGMQNYESLESRGMNIFGTTQNAQRWTIFRYVNQAHNTLTFNDSLQRVKGKAEILKSSDNPKFMFATTDLSEVYKGEIQKSVRGVAIKNKKYVIVQDEIETGAKPVKLRWSLVTPADIKIISDREILLTKDGKTLNMQISAALPVEIKTWSTVPKTDYDAPNPGTVIVGFETILPANSTSTFVVNLVPAKNKATVFQKTIPLSQWK